MSSSDLVKKRRIEFEKHIWNHADDAFQQSFDLKAPLSDEHLKNLGLILEAISEGNDDSSISDLIAAQLGQDPDFLYPLLQVAGLTRNKPKSDLTAPLAAEGIKVPTKIELFVKRPQVWALAGPYLVKRLKTVLSSLVGVPDEVLAGVFEAMSQATWPGYVRQERAKKSGGYAEQRIAIMLRQLRLPFQPEQKALDGLTSDAHFAGESFDLVIPNERAPRICIICMAHSSNIGQYGESKADDARRAMEALAATADPPMLLVFADGVGFYSNSAGLDTILGHADEFFQFETLWKCAVVAAYTLGIELEIVLPDESEHQAFLNTYSAAVRLADSADDSPGWVEAGEALVRRVS